MTPKMSVVSLFSGAGGLDWGFHLTSHFTTSLANEFKPAPAETLSANLKMQTVQTPASPSSDQCPLMIQGDIEELNFSKLNGFEPHVLIGGPPCQDFSIVKGGVRKGIEVKRGQLYSHFVRAIAALQPKTFIFENVPGLVSSNKRQAYKTILKDFSSVDMRWEEVKRLAHLDNNFSKKRRFGYEILFNNIIDTTKLGVPQTRRRLIIIGLRKDLTNSLGTFQLEQLKDHLEYQLNGKDNLFGKYPLTCMEVFEGYPIVDLKDSYRKAMKSYENLWKDLRTNEAKRWKEQVWDKLSLDPVEDYLFLNKIHYKDTSEFDKAMQEHTDILKELKYFQKRVDKLKIEDTTNDLSVESKTVIERMRRIPPGKNHVFVKGTQWNVEGRGLSLIYRRPYPLKPAPTVVAFGGGGTWGYHYERTRGKLTNRERARIQTFTDNFLFKGNTTEIRGQIGEAVPPLLARKLGESIFDILYEVGQV